MSYVVSIYDLLRPRETMLQKIYGLVLFRRLYQNIFCIAGKNGNNPYESFHSITKENKLLKVAVKGQSLGLELGTRLLLGP